METEVNGQQVLKPTVNTEVTWEYVIGKMIEKKLFPSGTGDSFRLKIFEDRALSLQQELLNLFVFFKQRMMEDMDAELTRLHEMHVEINKEIKETRWFWVKLRLKREAKDVIARMDGLKQAIHMMLETKLVPPNQKGDEKVK